MSTVTEVNFDGLVGPTHNFAGLSYGNVASHSNAASASNPKAAALQGLEKMQALMKLGYSQGVLPPHERPHIPTLRKLGFSGTDVEILNKVRKSSPSLLQMVSSASCMWVANAATISPSADTSDGKVHMTPANLAAMPHRAIEAEVTSRVLKSIFKNEDHFTHHAPLPAIAQFGDEGAANHTRLFDPSANKSVELFVFGKSIFESGLRAPAKFPARQTLEASQAIARFHGLDDTAIFAQQNPGLIDQGVFHNDVIAVGNGNCLFFHEEAFADKGGLIAALKTKLPNLSLVEVKIDQVSVKDCISTYLFNTQLLNIPENPDQMRLIAAVECRENSAVRDYLEELTSGNGPITDVVFMDVRQSMRNGGGPACLRLRVPLVEEELNSLTTKTILNDLQVGKLKDWVEKHYRDRLTADDLHDPKLLEECRTALDELTQILKIGSVYDFQLG